VPGSLPLHKRLTSFGFFNVYERDGMGVCKVGEGEVWISSQDRNFENRMGKFLWGRYCVELKKRN
jgi:homoaconitase/3-isopropylmalate dehydratase large subunit